MAHQPAISRKCSSLLMSRVRCNIRVSPVVESASKAGCVAAVLVDMRGEECVGTAGWGRDSAPNSPNSNLKSGRFVSAHARKQWAVLCCNHGPDRARYA
jgi:hypothetical protein